MRDWAENHVTMVLLGVDDERSLKEWEMVVNAPPRDFHALFIEPDMASQATALVVLPEDPTMFKCLRLL